jgi:hypothetical protein
MSMPRSPYKVLCEAARNEPGVIVLMHDGKDVARVPEDVFHGQLRSELPSTVIIRPGDHVSEE